MVQIIPMMEVFSVHFCLSGSSERTWESAEKIAKVPEEVRFA